MNNESMWWIDRILQLVEDIYLNPYNRKSLDEVTIMVLDAAARVYDAVNPDVGTEDDFDVSAGSGWVMPAFDAEFECDDIDDVDGYVAVLIHR